MPSLFTLSEGELRELNELSVESIGVVRKDSATAMSDTSKILVVGLGGMGLSTVHELKKRLVNRIGKLRSSDIQFLAFDTSEKDIESKRASGPLTMEETRLLMSPSLAQIMTQREDLRPLAFRAPMPPKNSGYNPTFAGQGAGQVRLTGRLSLMDSNTYQNVVTDIKRCISNLGDFTRRKLEIHVITGIGGGTGSGTCVDMPYIIRHVADMLHIPDGNLRMFGHVYLPNTYDTVPNMNLTKVYGNGYAALKEIDYYMNVGTIYETYDAIYPDGAFSSNKPIFDFCTLIGGHISAAIVIEDTKKAAISTCAENLINQVTHTVSKKNSYDRSASDSSIADIFTSAAFLDNVNAALSVVMSNGICNFHEGGNYKYNYVGASTLQFPTESIVEYFIGEVMAKTVSQLEQNTTKLTQKAVDEFEKGICIPFDVMAPYLNAFELQVDQLFENSVWNRATVAGSDIDASLAQIVNNIVATFDSKGDLASRACATASSKAAAIFRDPARGPYYLARLLTSISTSGSGIYGLYEKLNNYANVCNFNIEKLREAQARNRKEKQNLADSMQGFMHFKSNLENYKQSVRDIYMAELKIKLFEKMGNYYLPISTRVGLCYQLRTTLDNTYLTLTDILTHIGKILESNAKNRKQTVYEDDGEDSIFSLTETVFDALKNSVRFGVDGKLNQFGEHQIAKLAGQLLEDMVTHSDEWQLRGYNPLASAPSAIRFRNFVYNYEDFKDITGKTFTDYFESAYKNETESEKLRIVRYIADYLDTQASPMCNVYAPFTWNDVNVLCHRFMSIPNAMGSEWGDLFTSCLSANNQNILLSPDQNAIYNYTLYASMPIWIHGDLAKYEQSYLNSKDAGIHINESVDMVPPYADYPPLMPIQQWHRARQGSNEYSNKREVDYQNALSADIKKAIESGIICKNGNGMYVVELLSRRPNADEIREFFKQYSGQRGNFSKEELLMGGAKIRNAMKEVFGAQEKEIYRAGNLIADSEEKLLVLVRRQMKLVGALRSEMAFMAENVDKLVDEFNQVRLDKLRRKDATVFMLYGLIDADDRGMWRYHLGENVHNIIARLQVTVSSDLAQFAPYMEFVVCRKFFELEQAEGHRVLLKNKVNALNLSIFDSPAVLDTMKQNAQKYTAKAQKVIDMMTMKQANGESLTNEEVDLQSFYQQMLKDVTEVMMAVSAD